MDLGPDLVFLAAKDARSSNVELIDAEPFDGVGKDIEPLGEIEGEGDNEVTDEEFEMGSVKPVKELDDE